MTDFGLSDTYAGVMKGVILGNSPDSQLYDLSLDIGQIKNVATAQGRRVKQMSARLAEIRQGGRTRPLDSATAKLNPGDQATR